MYSQAEIEMFGQLHTVRHPAEVGLGLLPVVTAVLTVTEIAPGAAYDIALVALMTSDGVGIAPVLLFADL